MSRIVVSEPLYCKLRTSTSHTRKTHFLFGLSPLPDLLPLQARATCLMFKFEGSPLRPLHTPSLGQFTRNHDPHTHTHTLTRSLHAPLLPSTQQTNPENALGRLPRPESRRQTPSAHQSSHPCSTRHTPRHTPQHTPEHTHQNTACRLPRTTSIQHAAP